MAENTLYYGDNLDVLRLHVADGSMDLVYLDLPFKSARILKFLGSNPMRVRIPPWAC